MSRKTFGMALLLASMSAAPISAVAATYAVSVTDISNFSMTGGSATGWTFTQNLAINGATVLANGGALDSPGSCVFCAFNNSFVAHNSIGNDYSYGDTLIGNTAITSGTGAASAIAETYVSNGNTGSAYASNRMTAFLTTGVSGLLSFNFNVLSYLAVAVDNIGDAGTSEMSFEISISSMSGGNPIWTYSPTSLNQLLGPGDQSLAITNQAYSTGTTLAGNTQYMLNISMSQEVGAVSAVPLPAAVWLFGAGLLGLVAVGRRKIS